ncbi:GNAT family N-acetyltransferase [Pararobbsia silviterrae]|uniref:N-acetyltransferase n=1 Tax=Pararobbsia silviterrae TaxID=1792498 RepID=A0A494Y112_9BURK|nr:GNAT family N-acetyltransferase [Pararobbsia silviterrae]RKP55688.1 N-acetyltransferase [Pararobbsia silviterrae]
MSKNYRIRRATAADLPMVYIGELDAIRAIEPQNEARWKDALRWHLQQWTQSLDRMFVAERGTEKIGYCFWEAHGEAAVLASIYVLPEVRRSGLGRQLLERYIEDAHEKGFGNLTLGVKPDNPARALYEKAGFLYTHDERGYRHYRYPIVARDASS